MAIRDSIALLLVALFATNSLHANPGFSRPREVTEPILRPASLSQSDASVASDGEVVAGAWSHQGRHVMVSRFEKDGTPIDATPLLVSSIPFPSYADLEPTIVWTGQTYLVAWREGPATLRARTFSPGGALGPVSTIVSGANLRKIRIAASERRILVAVQDQGPTPFVPGAPVILGAILDPAGNLLSEARPLASFDNAFGFAVAAYSEGFLLLGARVDLEGTPAGNGYPSSVHAVPVSFDGDSGAEQLVTEARHAVFNLQAASNGSSVVAIWSSNLGIPGSIFTAHIEPGGTTSPPPVEVQQGLLNNQTLTFSGEGYVATIGDTTPEYVIPQTGIWSLLLDQRGRAAGPLTLLTTEGLPPLLSSSAVAIDGSVMVAMETTTGMRDIFGMLLDTSGRALSSAPFWLARSPSLQKSAAAAVAEDGTSLVAWVEERTDERRHVIVAAVLNASGETVQTRVLGEPELRSADEGPAVASNGREFAVVWFTPDRRLRAMLLSPSGEIIEATVIDLPEVQQRIALDLVWSGGAYVVGFLHRGASPLFTSLSTLRLGRSLDPLEESAVLVESGFRGEVFSLSEHGDRIIALYGGNPIKYSVLSATGAVDTHATSFHATDLDHVAGMAVWTDTESVMWGSVSTQGVTLISTVPSQRPESSGLSFRSTVAISRLGGGYILAWDEGVMTRSRTLHYLELDAIGNAASAVMTFESNLLDTGAPELVRTSGGAQLLYEGVDPADGAPEVTRIYLSQIERERPERRRPVQRPIGAGVEETAGKL
jgi:hypothetical protein